MGYGCPRRSSNTDIREVGRNYSIKPSYEGKIENVTPFLFESNDDLNVSYKSRMIIDGVAFHHKWVRGTHGGHQTRAYAKSAVFIVSALG